MIREGKTKEERFAVLKEIAGVSHTYTK